MTKAIVLAELADQNALTVDGSNNRVGIASTQPTVTLDVGGGGIFAGVVTATSFSGSFDGSVSGDATGLSGTPDIDVTNITGVAATFTGAIDANGSLDVDGHTELDDVNVSGLSTFVGNVSFGSSALFGDNDKILLGSDDDFEIYHDGSDGYIDNATGELYIRDTNAAGTNRIFIQPKAGENAIIAREDGNVELYHDNSKKIETTSSGAIVTGILTATTFSGSGASLTDIPFASLTGITTEIVGDTTPQLGGELDVNGNDITGTGNVNLTGIITATSFDGDGSSLTTLNASNISSGTISDNRLPGTITSNITGDLTGTASNASGATGDFSIADKIVHTGDTNTAIRFPANDTFTVETAGSERIRVLSGGGLTFNGDTSTNNALDDYEEGTWTPTFTALNGTGTFTYQTQTGQYTKIGNRVVCTGHIKLSAVSGTGTDVFITGLPYTPNSNSDSGAVGNALNWTTLQPTVVLSNTAANALQLRATDALQGSDNIDLDNFTSTSEMRFEIVYRVAS